MSNIRYHYDTARNAVAIGWALSLLGVGLSLNVLLLLVLSHSPAFIVGAALAVAGLGAAYFVESWRTYGCSRPALYRIAQSAVPFLTSLAHVAWVIGASIA